MTSSVKRGSINVNIVTGAALFALMLLLNFMCPYLSDDWHFMFVWEDFLPTDEPDRVDSFGDIITSMRNYYAMSGGRVVPHFITYCLLLFPKWVFNILNSAMFVVLTVLLYKISLCYLKSSPKWLYPLVCLMALHLLPGFGDNVLWISGAVNYLWMAVILLCCIYWLIARSENAGLRECLFMLPVFMLSGATNEVTGGMLIVAVVIRFFCIKNHKPSKIAMFIILLLSEIPGMLFVLLAPGNKMRVVHTEKLGFETHTPLFENLSDYMWFLIKEYLPFMILIFLAAAVCALRQETMSVFLHKHLCFIVGMCGVAALSAIGFFIKRPTFFGCSLLIPTIIISVDTLRELFSDNQSSVSKRLIFGVKVFLDSAAALMVILAILDKTIALYLATLVLIVIMRILISVLKFDSNINTKRKLTYDGLIKYIKIGLSAIMITLSVNVILNTINYMRGTSAYIDFQNNLKDLINEHKSDMVSELYFLNSDFGAFFPDESAASFDYMAAWLTEYCESENLG